MNSDIHEHVEIIASPGVWNRIVNDWCITTRGSENCNVFKDNDNDGIANKIDTQPDTFSNNFSDKSIGGVTNGTILDRGDQNITINAGPFPAAGVRITNHHRHDISTINPKVSRVVLNCDGYRTRLSLGLGVDEFFPCLTPEQRVNPLITQPVVEPVIINSTSQQMGISALIISRSAILDVGVNNATAYIEGPFPSTKMISNSKLSLVSGDTGTGIWQGSIMFPSDALDGKYKIEIKSFASSIAGTDTTMSKAFIPIVLDRTSPVILGKADRIPDNTNTNATNVTNSHGLWYNKPLTIGWDGNDGEYGSGIRSCDNPITYSGPDRASITITGHCIDNAGNTGQGVMKFNYDSISPDTIITNTMDGNNITIPIDKTGITVSNKIVVSFTGTDDMGVAGFQCRIDNQSARICGGGSNNNNPITIAYSNLQAGMSHRLEIRAIDFASNLDSTPSSFTWFILTPAQGIQKLMDFIKSLQIDNNVKISLDAPLGQSQIILTDNNPHNDKAACNLLTAFIHQAKAHVTGGKLSSQQYSQLIQTLSYSAQSIKMSLEYTV